MISPENYYTVYLILVLILSLFVARRYSTFTADQINMGSRSLFPVVVFVFFMAVFVGARPYSPVFADMGEYYFSMLDHRFENTSVQWNENFIFVQLMAFMSRVGVSPQGSVTILALVNYLFTLVAVRKMFPNDTFIVLLAFLGAFSTFNYTVNGIKAGCAAAVFLCGIAYREKKILCLLFLVLSYGMHHAMQLPIAVFFICIIFRNPKYYLALWCISLIIAALHIKYFQVFFGNLTDEHGSTYLLGDGSFVKTSIMGGFRIDFILYSLAPIIIGTIAYYKKKIQSEPFVFLFNLYTLANSIWLLCMYAEFTNRIAYLSWFMYPILLLYPILNENWSGRKYLVASRVFIGQLGFTLLITYVYTLF